MAPVHDAAEGNDVEALQRLLDANPQLIEAEGPCPPLYHACRAGAVEAAQYLLDRGASTTWAGNVDLTPLFGACCAGRDEVVALLLARGVDPTVRNNRGQTVMMSASYGPEECPKSDHVAVIRRLLKDGRVPVNARDDKGCTALWWACLLDKKERAGALLVDGAADFSTVDHVRVGDYGGEDTTACKGDSTRTRKECIEKLKVYDGEIEKLFLLNKARAITDATESITKAPEKAEAKTEGEAQRAREGAAPAYLKDRVRMGEALPVVELVGGLRRAFTEEEERVAICEFVVRWMGEDLYLEMMEGLQRYGGAV